MAESSPGGEPPIRELFVSPAAVPSGGSAMPGSVIVSSARTPIGRLSGAFSSLTAADLGGHGIKAGLSRAGVSPDLVDYVYVGQVIQAGSGQMPARQAAVKA